MRKTTFLFDAYKKLYSVDVDFSSIPYIRIEKVSLEYWHKAEFSTNLACVLLTTKMDTVLPQNDFFFEYFPSQ